MEDEFPNLQNNKEKNASVYKPIITLSLGAIGSFLVLVITSGLHDTPILLNEIFVAVLLVAISVQSIAFYRNVVILLRENTIGKMLSVLLSIVLICLFVLTYRHVIYSLVTAGIAFIFAKSLQLYYFVPSKQLAVTKSYFKRVCITYAVLLIISTLAGALIDFGYLNSLFAKSFDTQAIAAALKSPAAEPAIGAEGLNELLNRLALYESILKFSLICLTYVVVLLIAFTSYKVYIVRDISLTKLYQELERYYKKDGSPRRNPQGPPSRILSLFILIRPFVSSLSGFMAGTVYFSNSNHISSYQLLAVVATVSLTSAFGFAINDYYDYEKDQLGHPTRVLPSGKIPRSYIPWVLLVLSISALVFSVSINGKCFAIDFTTLVCLFAYSFINNRYGFFANLITAGVCSLIFVFGMAASSFNLCIAMSSVVVFLFILSREILLDVRDIDADTMIGKSSVPILMGDSKARSIAMILLILGSLLSIYIGITLGSFNYLWFISIGFNLVVWSSFIKYLLSPTSDSLVSYFKWSRVAFCLIVLGLF